MSVFLEIAQEKLKDYIEEIMYLLGKGHGMTEFCLLPIMDKSFHIDEITKKKLQKIVNCFDDITKTIEQLKTKLDKINI